MNAWKVSKTNSVLLEHFRAILNRSDGEIFCQDEEAADERSGATVEAADAVLAKKGPSLWVAHRCASASLRSLPDAPHRVADRA